MRDWAHVLAIMSEEEAEGMTHMRRCAGCGRYLAPGALCPECTPKRPAPAPQPQPKPRPK